MYTYIYICIERGRERSEERLLTPLFHPSSFSSYRVSTNLISSFPIVCPSLQTLFFLLLIINEYESASVSLLHALSRVPSLFRTSPSFSDVAEPSVGEGESGGGFRGGTTGFLSRLSPAFLVAHGRRGERIGARFRGVAHRRAREWRGEGRGCSQSVPKTFTIARLGSLALALSLGLCLMAYLPM